MAFYSQHPDSLDVAIVSAPEYSVTLLWSWTSEPYSKKNLLRYCYEQT